MCVVKNRIKNLCIISGRYPSEKNPVYTFVDQLVCELADRGINCVVISPSSISKCIIRKINTGPRESIRETKTGNKIKVYRPKYFSFSNKLLNINTAMITYICFKRCVLNEFKKRKLTPDAIYGHFILPSGMCAAELGEIFDIPSFLAYGESSTENFLVFSRSFIAKKLSKLNGVISVSSENKRELLDLKLINNSNDIGVFPNGIDNTRFYKIDKGIARKQLGIDDDKFVVAFVGHFTERKGVIVLSDALNQLQDVYSIFIGAGSDEPQCKNILFKGRVPHEQVHIYLNAADVFVLPTLAEGCCNAIIEAMACGLPIISSDQPFNDDILNTENSIRLDVKDVEAIRQAIVLLRDNPQLRSKMSEVALISASSLNIKQRAQNIIEFMESKI
jgi:glycosyltransferase involved in cell wall biosynthesis